MPIVLHTVKKELLVDDLLSFLVVQRTTTTTKMHLKPGYVFLLKEKKRDIICIHSVTGIEWVLYMCYFILSS